MPVVPLAFCIVITNNPLTLHNIYKRILITMWFVMRRIYLPQPYLDNIASILSDLDMLYKPALHCRYNIPLKGYCQIFFHSDEGVDCKVDSGLFLSYFDRLSNGWRKMHSTLACHGILDIGDGILGTGWYLFPPVPHVPYPAFTASMLCLLLCTIKLKDELYHTPERRNRKGTPPCMLTSETVLKSACSPALLCFTAHKWIVS